MNRRLHQYILVCLISAAAPALQTTSVFSQSSWKQQEFVLGTFWDPPCDAQRRNLDRDAANFRLAKAAHFNLLTGAQLEPGIDRSFDGMVWALTVARAAGLRYMVTDRRFYPAYEQPFSTMTGDQVLRDYTHLPADLRSTMYGYTLCDEPHYTAAHLLKVSDWKWFLEAGDPDKLVYINLVASYAPSYNWGGFKGGHEDGVLDHGGKQNYERYLTSYVDSLRPAVVSFDHYPFFRNGNVRRDYFYNLAIIRAKASGRPFWAYPMTVDHLTYADPTEAQLNFMYFCPIAYGARGLVAFCFWAPSDEKEYRLSLIDRSGKPTVKYPIVSRLNLYVERFLGPIVMNTRHVAVYHASGFPGEQQFLDDTLKAETGVVASSENRRLLFGVFQTASTLYLMIVNKDLAPAMKSEITLRGMFASVSLGPRSVRFTATTPLTYTALKFRASSVNTRTTFQIPELAGGEGILVRMTGAQPLNP